MTLPVSGAISLSQVNVELGLSATAQIDMNNAAVRTLFGVPSGAISMSNGYGKSNEFPFAISANQTNANLRTLAVNAGWNQSSRVVATINSGIYCSANGTGTPGLTVSGSFPGGVELINNGFIIGMGGAGGQGRHGGNSNPGLPGAGGGQGLNVSVALTLRNNGTIGGGGGGGGGGGTGYHVPGKTGLETECGSGGGGGRTGTTNSAAGGRQRTDRNGVNGNQGTLSAAGAQASAGVGGFGGAGGNWGASGNTGGKGNTVEGGPPGGNGGAGGGAGAAVVGNGNITYLATGTRLGAIT